MGIERHLHVLAHAERREGRGDLEGAAHAQAPDRAGRRPTISRPPSRTEAAVGRELAVQHVEAGALARAIGADQRQQLAGVDGEGHVGTACTPPNDFERPRTSSRGSWLMRDAERQRRVRAGRGASLERSALCADSPAVLGLAACRITRYVRFALCAQTDAASQRWMRAARAAASPALLGAPEARRDLPGRAFAAAPVALRTRAPTALQRGRRCPVGAISVATRSAGPRSARAARIHF